MRHTMPHRNNIGVAPRACKIFLGSIRPFSAQRVVESTVAAAVCIFHPEKNEFKSEDYAGGPLFGNRPAATIWDSRHAVWA